MDTYTTPKGDNGEKWSAQSNELVVEREIELSDRLENVSIDFAQGLITVVGDETLTKPVLTTRLSVQAENEEDARRYLKECGRDLLEQDNDVTSLNLSSMASQGTTIITGGGRGGVFVGGNIVVGGNIYGGDVIVNGRKVNTSGRGATIVPGASIEVTLRVPTNMGIRYELSNQAGATELENTHGEINFRTSAGQLSVAGHEGRVSIQSASGDVTLADIAGEVNAQTASGDVRINGIKGSVQLQTTSGNVSISQAELEGRNNSVRTTSGNQTVELRNSSIVVRAEGMGSIRTGRRYVVDKDNRQKGGRGSGGVVVNGDFVGGNVVSTGRGNIVVSGGSVVIGGSGGGQSSVDCHIGTDTRSAISLRLSAMSGDITLR